MRGVFCGDWHYGLSVEDLDRTPDVHKAVEFIIDEAIRVEADFVSVGGDLTDNNTPLPDHIALLIQVFNRLEEAEIPTFVLRGNHEAISAPGRLWALTPLERVGYENVHFITEPKLINYEDVTFLFLPHATRSQAIEHGFKTAQEFIDAKAEELLKKVSKTCTVISHYNVNGARAGTEAMMLRQTDLQLPAIVMRSPKVEQIVNSHIHTAQTKGKIIMPGSRVCTDFGDLDSAKGFLIGDYDGGWEFETINTPASPMQSVEIDLVGESPEGIRKTIEAVKKTVVKDSIVKIRVMVEEEKVGFVDFDKLRGEFAKKARFVKQIDRIITRKRQVRDPNQKPSLKPIDAVKQYLDFRSPEGKDRKHHLAMRVMSGEELGIKDSGSSFSNQTAAIASLDSALDELADDGEIDFDNDVIPDFSGEAIDGPSLDL